MKNLFSVKSTKVLLLLIAFFFCSIKSYAQTENAQDVEGSVLKVLSPEARLRQKVLANPTDMELFQKLFYTYQQQGKLKTANSLVLQVSRQNEEIPIKFLKQAVSNALVLKDYIGTLQFTRLVNARTPEDADNLNSMGLALYALKKYGVAQAAFEMSVYLDPHNYRFITNLARDLALIGDIPRAKENYQKALAINPSYSLAKRNLSRMEGEVATPLLKKKQKSPTVSSAPKTESLPSPVKETENSSSNQKEDRTSPEMVSEPTPQSSSGNPNTQTQQVPSKEEVQPQKDEEIPTNNSNDSEKEIGNF